MRKKIIERILLAASGTILTATPVFAGQVEDDRRVMRSIYTEISEGNIPRDNPTPRLRAAVEEIRRRADRIIENADTTNQDHMRYAAEAFGAKINLDDLGKLYAERADTDVSRLPDPSSRIGFALEMFNKEVSDTGLQGTLRWLALGAIYDPGRADTLVRYHEAIGFYRREGRNLAAVERARIGLERVLETQDLARRRFPNPKIMSPDQFAIALFCDMYDDTQQIDEYSEAVQTLEQSLGKVSAVNRTLTGNERAELDAFLTLARDSLHFHKTYLEAARSEAERFRANIASANSIQAALRQMTDSQTNNPEFTRTKGEEIERETQRLASYFERFGNCQNSLELVRGIREFDTWLQEARRVATELGWSQSRDTVVQIWNSYSIGQAAEEERDFENAQKYYDEAQRRIEELVRLRERLSFDTKTRAISETEFAALDLPPLEEARQGLLGKIAQQETYWQEYQDIINRRGAYATRPASFEHFRALLENQGREHKEEAERILNEVNRARRLDSSTALLLSGRTVDAYCQAVKDSATLARYNIQHPLEFLIQERAISDSFATEINKYHDGMTSAYSRGNMALALYNASIIDMYNSALGQCGTFNFGISTDEIYRGIFDNGARESMLQEQINILIGRQRERLEQIRDEKKRRLSR